MTTPDLGEAIRMMSFAVNEFIEFVSDPDVVLDDTERAVWAGRFVELRRALEKLQFVIEARTALDALAALDGGP